ncbi:hypothetical protein AB0H43_12500 [Hamadaea sp. NPDC050747]|uniref:hypothetical protein n=1 Tax=Hamadaea sp. NPDC050747 TaxID=3155789 RepID=UPI0033EF545F
MTVEYDRGLPSQTMINAARTPLWVRGEPTTFVRTPEFVALIGELLRMLQDPFTPQKEAYVAVRRATRILKALVAEAERRESAKHAAS